MAPDTAAPHPGVTATPSAPDLQFRMEPEYYIGTYFLIMLFFGLVIIAYLPLTVSYIAFGSVHAPLQRATMYLSGTYFLLLLFARFARSEMDKVRFIVSDRSIVKASSFSVTEIAFADITRFSVHAWPLIKGYVRIDAPGRRIILPSTIHRFGDLEEALVARLAAGGRGDLCDRESVGALHRIALVAAFSQARSRAAFFPLVFTTLPVAAFNALVAGTFWGADSVTLVIWSGFSLFVPLFVYGLADYRLNRSVERQLLRDPLALPGISLPQELLFSTVVVTLACAAAGILFKTFVIGPS